MLNQFNDECRISFCHCFKTVIRYSQTAEVGCDINLDSEDDTFVSVLEYLSYIYCLTPTSHSKLCDWVSFIH